MGSKFKPVDADAVSHDELKSAYRNLLNSRNALKDENDSVRKYQRKTTEIINVYIPHCALILQALADRAGVRRSSAIQAILSVFDAISHPQWSADELPELPELPVAIDDDAPGYRAQSGDVEMLVEARIAAALAPFNTPMHSPTAKDGIALSEAVRMYLCDTIDHFKSDHGFQPKHVDIGDPSGCEVCRAMGWAALDLAQDLDTARNFLRLDLRDAAYSRALDQAYRLSQIPHLEVPTNFDVKVIGEPSW